MVETTAQRRANIQRIKTSSLMTPSRTRAENIAILTGGRIGGGGKTKPTQITSKERDLVQLRKDQASKLQEAKDQFRQDMRTAKGISGRTEAQKKFRDRVADIKVGGEKTSALVKSGLSLQQSRTELTRGEDFKPQLVVSEAPKQYFFKGIQQDLNRFKRKGETKLARGESLTIPEITAQIVAGGLSPFVDIAVLEEAIIMHPILTSKSLWDGIKNINIEEIGERIGQSARDNPPAFTGAVLGELLLMRGLGRGAEAGADVIDLARTRASGKFAPIKDVGGGRRAVTGVETEGFFERSGATIKSLTGEDVTHFKGSGTAKFDIPIIEKGWVDIALDKQVRLGGKDLDLVVHAGGDAFRLGKNKLVVGGRGEKGFEGLFFADPFGRIRRSRLQGLGDQPSATLMDILLGDFRFRRARPQVLYQERVRLAKFPKELKDIQETLKKNGILTPSQEARYLKWLDSNVGQWKPVGRPTTEPEVVLGTGEIVIKEKLTGVSIESGRRIEIFRVRVGKASPETRALLLKKSRGKLTKLEETKLKRNLKKETKGLSSQPVPTTPFLSSSRILVPPPTALGVKLGSVSQNIEQQRRSIRDEVKSLEPQFTGLSSMQKNMQKSLFRNLTIRGVSRDKINQKLSQQRKLFEQGSPRAMKDAGGMIRESTKTPIPRVVKGVLAPKPMGRKPPTPVGKLIPRPFGRKGTGRVGKLIPRPFPYLKGKRRPLKKGKELGAWDSLVKVKGKFKKQNIVPLSKKHARSLGAWVTDKSLSATHKVKRRKGTPQTPKRKFPLSHFSRTREKYRGFMIRKGKKIQTPNQWIEKRNKRLDSRSEVKQIQQAKKLKKLPKPFSKRL